MNAKKNFGSASSTGTENLAIFKAKNYRNSPIVREFYRFVAKNGLRAQACKLLNEIAVDSSKEGNDYLSTVKF